MESKLQTKIIKLYLKSERYDQLLPNPYWDISAAQCKLFWPHLKDCATSNWSSHDFLNHQLLAILNAQNFRSI